MTIFEWKITDLGNGEFGYIWIASDGKDEFGNLYKIYVDPYNIDATADVAFKYEAQKFFNLEITEDDAWYRRVLLLWKRLGSPRIDRKAPGYDAPWFPWLEAGFTADERDSIIAEPSTEGIEVQHE
jgi:hypothetical protein